MKTVKRLTPMFVALAIAVTLAACGGGGGGSTTTPAVTPPVTFACWDGSVLTGTVQPTKVGCAAVTDSAIKAAVTGSMLSFTGIPSGAALTGSTLVSQNGNSSITFTNGTITSGTMLFSTTYTFTGGKLTFSNAPDLTIAGSFVTGPDPATCTLPSMKNSFGVCISPPAVAGYSWNNTMKAWVADIGVLVTGANTLPDSCFLIGDACWKENVANGKIKFVNSGIIMTGQNTRPIIFAYYVIGGFSNGNPAAGFHNVVAMYADVEATSPAASQVTWNGGVYFTIPTIKGTASGAKVTATGLTAGVTSTGTACYERIWFVSGVFAFTSTNCPI